MSPWRGFDWCIRHPSKRQLVARQCCRIFSHLEHPHDLRGAQILLLDGHHTGGRGVCVHVWLFYSVLYSCTEVTPGATVRVIGWITTAGTIMQYTF